ncbi:MAG TPA: NAD(P)/FAD-dependent oxidoreductase [Miltoncostaeaceae bacterium]|jgi:2-polyprenyl-6-methoxyphenol hydroxylase-like FAD-dependent oxidoreductase|nr:NAD(P)/FAD-dependent oxidoreductase [Miltoncostaeaceae bacterium]
MNIVICGGGMVGMTLAHLLRRRGFSPVVIERQREGEYMPRGYMLGFQGYEPLNEAGVFEEVRAQGRPIVEPREGEPPPAVAVRFGALIEALARDLPVVYEHTVVELVRDADDRIVGVEVEGPDGRTTIDSDLVVACDGVMSPARTMAGLTATVDELADGTLTWMGDQPTDLAFKMSYLSDGGHIGLLSWPEGAAGWRTIEKIGREAALAPGLDAIKKMWIELMPEAEKGLEAVTSLDQIRYGEPKLLSCDRWWVPGLVIIGDAAHFFGPETGVSSGIGLGDAHALAQAVAQNRDDPDAVCRSYELWRLPVVRPYEAMDPGRQRLVPGNGVTRDEERWPPAS